MDGLEGRSAIVTGGSTLIGRAVVRELHGHGMSVAIADIDDGPGEALATELGERVLFRHTDITARRRDRGARGGGRRAASAASTVSSTSPAPISTTASRRRAPTGSRRSTSTSSAPSRWRRRRIRT